jgi:hypothetical protein
MPFDRVITRNVIGPLWDEFKGKVDIDPSLNIKLSHSLQGRLFSYLPTTTGEVG